MCALLTYILTSWCLLKVAVQSNCSFGMIIVSKMLLVKQFYGKYSNLKNASHLTNSAHIVYLFHKYGVEPATSWGIMNINQRHLNEYQLGICIYNVNYSELIAC